MARPAQWPGEVREPPGEHRYDMLPIHGSLLNQAPTAITAVTIPNMPSSESTWVATYHLDLAIPGLDRPQVAQRAERLVHCLPAGTEQGGDGGLGELDVVAVARRLLDEEVGHLGDHGLVHEVDDAPLRLLELAQAGDEPAQAQRRVLGELGEQLVARKAEGAHLVDARADDM